MKKITIIGIHSISSHSGWFYESRKWFEKQEYYFYTQDRRGSGRLYHKRGVKNVT